MWQRTTLVYTIFEIEPRRDERAQRAKVRLRPRVESGFRTSMLAPGIEFPAVVEIVADASVIADNPADLEAGLGSRNVEEARALGVANANIFDGLGFGDDDCVRGACTRCCDKGRSGAEKKALDVHF